MPKEPEQVTRATKLYRAKNDTFMNFITEKIVDDIESTMTISDMYAEFKEWYKSSYSTNYNIPPRTELRDYFEKYYKGRFHVNRVSGVRYRKDEDDEILILLTKNEHDQKNEWKGKQKEVEN